MKMKLQKWDGVVYAITLALVVGLIMVEAKFIKVLENPMWALISGILCTELQIDQTHLIVVNRLIVTLLGILIALVVIAILGPGYAAIITGVILITLVCHYLIHVGSSWKLATATGAIVLISTFHQQSIVPAEITAYQRGAEVLFGSLTGGLISLGFGKIWQKIKTL